MDGYIKEVGDRAIFYAQAVGAVSTNAKIELKSDRENFHLVAGRYLYKLVTKPAAAGDAPAAWTGDIKDADGREVLPITTRSTTDVEEIMGFLNASGAWEPIMSDWEINLTAIGNGKIVDVEAWFH